LHSQPCDENGYCSDETGGQPARDLTIFDRHIMTFRLNLTGHGAKCGVLKDARKRAQTIASEDLPATFGRSSALEIEIVERAKNLARRKRTSEHCLQQIALAFQQVC
jgi:hypothetical protein